MCRFTGKLYNSSSETTIKLIYGGSAYLMNIDSYNNRIIKLWYDYKEEKNLELSPLLYPEPEQKCILFIGLNPATDPKDISSYELYKFDNIKNNKGKIIEHFRDNVSKLTWMKYFHDYLEQMNWGWAYIDLFYYREPKQNTLKTVIFNNKKLNKFACAQLKITEHIIRDIKPRAVIVVNADATKIIRGEKGYKFNNIRIEDFNEDYGTYIMKIDSVKCPAFFTGAMSTDKETLIRLAWHIKYVLRKNHKT